MDCELRLWIAEPQSAILSLKSHSQVSNLIPKSQISIDNRQSENPRSSIRNRQFGAILARPVLVSQKVPLWGWWILVVLAISFPWSGLVSNPQWDRVHPIPFTDPADRPRDFLANILLFVPFGYSYRRRGSVWRAVGIAAAVSVAAEATQLFSTTRFPSATDITAALAGSALGAVAASLLTRMSAGGEEKASPAK